MRAQNRADCSPDRFRLQSSTNSGQKEFDIPKNVEGKFECYVQYYPNTGSTTILECKKDIAVESYKTDPKCTDNTNQKCSADCDKESGHNRGGIGSCAHEPGKPYCCKKSSDGGTDNCAPGASGTCQSISASYGCPDGGSYLGLSQTCQAQGKICCGSGSGGGTDVCAGNCGTGGTCACAKDSDCASPKTILSAGNAYCASKLADGVCCRTPNGGGGGGNGGRPKCDSEYFEEYAGVCFPKKETTGLSQASVKDILVNLGQWLFGILGVIAVVLFVICGFQYLAAGVDESMAERGKRCMTYSIVGVIIALSALVIIFAIDHLLAGTL